MKKHKFKILTFVAVVPRGMSDDTVVMGLLFF